MNRETSKDTSSLSNDEISIEDLTNRILHSMISSPFPSQTQPTHLTTLTNNFDPRPTKRPHIVRDDRPNLNEPEFHDLDISDEELKAISVPKNRTSPQTLPLLPPIPEASNESTHDLQQTPADGMVIQLVLNTSEISDGFTQCLILILHTGISLHFTRGWFLWTATQIFKTTLIRSLLDCNSGELSGHEHCKFLFQFPHIVMRRSLPLNLTMSLVPVDSFFETALQRTRIGGTPKIYIFKTECNTSFSSCSSHSNQRGAESSSSVFNWEAFQPSTTKSIRRFPKSQKLEKVNKMNSFYKLLVYYNFP